MRDISTAFNNELLANNICPRFLFEGNFGGTWQRYTTHDSDLIYNSNTYVSNGYLDSISSYEESSDIISNGMKVNITSEPDAILSLFLNNAKHGQAGAIYFVLINFNTQAIVDVHKIFDGYLDGVQIIDGIDSATAVLSYESALIRLKKVLDFKYSDKIQRLFFPSDAGFQYVEQLQNWGGYWGKTQKLPEQKKQQGKKDKDKKKGKR